MKLTLYILSLVFLITLYGCQSPMDLDTPKKKITPVVPKPIQTTLVKTILTTNNVESVLDIGMLWNSLEIDTSKSPYIINGDLTLNLATLISSNYDNLRLLTLSLTLNDMKVSGIPVVLDGKDINNSYIEYLLIRDPNRMFDTTVTSGKNLNISNLSFSIDKEKRDIWINLDATLSDNKIIADTNNPGKFLREPDELFILGKFNFTY